MNLAQTQGLNQLAPKLEIIDEPIKTKPYKKEPEIEKDAHDAAQKEPVDLFFLTNPNIKNQKRMLTSPLTPHIKSSPFEEADFSDPVGTPKAPTNNNKAWMNFFLKKNKCNPLNNKRISSFISQ